MPASRVQGTLLQRSVQQPFENALNPVPPLHCSSATSLFHPTGVVLHQKEVIAACTRVAVQTAIMDL